jgi:hypothetical protein
LISHALEGIGCGRNRPSFVCVETSLLLLEIGANNLWLLVAVVAVLVLVVILIGIRSGASEVRIHVWGVKVELRWPGSRPGDGSAPEDEPGEDAPGEDAPGT